MVQTVRATKEAWAALAPDDFLVLSAPALLQSL